MNCQDFQRFADAYVDGEFGDCECAEVESHLRDCQECRQQVESKIRFKEQFQNALAAQQAPQALRERIAAGIDDVDRDGGGAHPVVRTAMAGGGLAASVALVLFFLPQFTVMPASSEQLPVVENTVDWHKGNFPIEVNGPQSQKVARWFHGKVDFPVRLPQFHSTKVHLIGGRLAHVEDHRAAYALYEADGARLSVMMFHADDFKVPSDQVRKIGNRDVAVLNNNGYEVAVLQDDGVTYTITSDLPEREMLDLVGTSLTHGQ